MNFYFNGKKPSKGYDVAGGLLLVIAFSAIIYMFTLLESIDDLKEYALQLILALIIGGSFLFQFFRKKGKPHYNKIEIANGFLLINSFKIPTENITLDIYVFHKSFIRYHLWDSKGMFSIYSVFEDDFFNNFKTSFAKNTNTYEEVSSSTDGSLVSIKSTIGSLRYDLEVGEFTLQKEDNPVFKTTPEFFIYDPKYKQGKPFLKNKKNE